MPSRFKVLRMREKAANPRNRTVLIDCREIDKLRGLGHFTRELLFSINQSFDASRRVKFVAVVPAKTSKHYVLDMHNIEFLRLWSPDQFSGSR